MSHHIPISFVLEITRCSVKAPADSDGADATQQLDHRTYTSSSRAVINEAGSPSQPPELSKELGPDPLPPSQVCEVGAAPAAAMDPRTSRLGGDTSVDDEMIRVAYGGSVLLRATLLRVVTQR